MFCSKCGQQLADHAKFCSRCGTPTGATATAPEAPVAIPVPVPTTQPASTPVTVPVSAPTPVQQAAPQAMAGPRRLYFDAKGLTMFNYKFEIKDQRGIVCYHAATLSESMVTYNAMLYDAYGNDLIKVSQQKKMTLAAMNFDFLTPQGGLLTHAMQQTKMFNYEYILDGFGITITGNFLKMTFDFVRNGVPIAKVSKKVVAWGDCYEVEFSDPNLEQVLLASVLMIQLVCAANRRRRR